MPTERTALARVFPQSVHDSLAELRRIAREAKSRHDPRLRRATPEERALAETQRKPHACRASSNRTGLPCTNARVLGMRTCRKHGGSTKQAIAKAEQRLREMTETILERLYALTLQDKHLPAAVNAGRDLLDRIGVGAVVQAKVRASKHHGSDNRVIVQVGFLNQGAEHPAIAVDCVTAEDEE